MVKKTTNLRSDPVGIRARSEGSVCTDPSSPAGRGRDAPEVFAPCLEALEQRLLLAVVPPIEWISQVGTVGQDPAFDVAVDASGNSFVVGYTGREFLGTYNGKYDPYLIKFDSDGDQDWGIQFGSTVRSPSGEPTDDWAEAVAVDEDGNIFVAGAIERFHPEGGYWEFQVFLTKFSPVGAEVWRVEFGTPPVTGNEHATDLAVDGAGNVYLSGYSGGGYGYYGDDRGVSLGLNDSFLVKYNNDGDRQWVRFIGDIGDDLAQGIAVDNRGNTYVAGSTTSDLDPDGYGAGLEDIFVAQYDAAGTRQWIKQIGTEFREWATGVGVDGDGNTYLSGYTNGNLGGANLGGTDALLLKRDPDGDAVWTRQFGTAAADRGTAIAMDLRGGSYTVGYTSGALTGANHGGEDAFVVKYNSDGVPQWTQQVGTAGADQGVGVDLDSRSNVYYAGSTTGELAPGGGGGTDFDQDTFLVDGGGGGKDFAHDFDGDGFADIAWRNAADGTNLVWYMDGDGLVQVATLPQVADLNWRMVGQGDFNRDGYADLLWRNGDTGEMTMWFMEGNTIDEIVGTTPVADFDWHVAGVDDFNGDGYGDILWRHTPTSTNNIWFMNGATLVTQGGVADLGAGWRPVGAGDFNDDGFGDILWRHEDGSNSMAYMNGSTRVLTVPILDWADTNWQVGTVGDFSGDGYADILWRSAAGANQLWTMQGGVRILWRNADSLDPVWAPPGTRGETALPTAGIQGDFDGDGKGDILWRHEGGTNHIWFMDGTAIASTGDAPAVADPDWDLAAWADFDGDGKTDLLWRHPSGQNHIWFMDGATVASAGDAPAVADTSWSIAGAGDFDGDGKGDILWRNEDGTNHIWFMDGTTILSTANPPAVGDASWQVGGVGDFDGDGKADILWRHAGGSNQIWFMDGGTSTAASDLPSVDPAWYVGWVADFDGDGKADIIWRHEGGTNQVWFMDGATSTGSADLPTVSIDWYLPGRPDAKPDPEPSAAIQGDFDGDGYGDIVWRHSSGANILWFMEGGTIREQTALPSVGDPDWEIAGVGDFNGDGKSDLLWRHGVVGQNIVWFMDGGAIASSVEAPMVNDVNWQVGGVGDFDGDGKADVLWRHSTGQSVLWFMDGATIASSSDVTPVPDAAWRIAGVGDFDGDGKADVLWRHSSGYNHMWFMDGATIVSEAAPPAVADTGWQVGAVGDFDGDGKADLLWRHATGLDIVWFMDGTSILSTADLPAVPTDWDVI